MELCELVVFTLAGSDAGALPSSDTHTYLRKDYARTLSLAIAEALNTGIERIRITGPFVQSENQDWKINVLIMPPKDPADPVSSRTLAEECKRQVSDPQSSFRLLRETASIIDATMLCESHYAQEIAVGKGSLLSMIVACRWYYQTNFRNMIAWHSRCLRLKSLANIEVKLNCRVQARIYQNVLDAWYPWSRSKRRLIRIQVKIEVTSMRTLLSTAYRTFAKLSARKRRLLQSAFIVCRQRISRQLYQVWARWRMSAELAKSTNWGIDRVHALSSTYRCCDALRMWYFVVNTNARAKASPADEQLDPATMVSAELEAVRISVDPCAKLAQLARWQKMALIGQRIQRRQLCNPVVASLRRWSAAVQNARRLGHAEGAITRRRAVRRLRQIWTHLRVQADIQRRVRSLGMSLVSRATAASVALWFRAWARVARHRTARRGIVGRFVHRAGLFRAHGLLQAWSACCVRSSRLMSIQQRLRLMFRSRTVGSYFGAWHERVVLVARARRRGDRAHLHLREGKLCRTFDAWGVFCAQAAKSRADSRASAAEEAKAADAAQLRDSVLTAACRRLWASQGRAVVAKALWVWGEWRERRLQLARTLVLQRTRNDRSAVAGTCAAWVAFTAESRLEKQRTVRVCAIAFSGGQRLLRAHWQLWVLHVHAQRRLKGLGRKAAVRLLHSRMVASWGLFRKRVLEIKQVRRRMQSVVQHWRGGLLSRSLEMWACNAARLVEERSAAARADSNALRLAAEVREAEERRQARLASVCKRLAGRWLGMQIAVYMSFWAEFCEGKRRLREKEKALSRTLARLKLSALLSALKQQAANQKRLRRLGSVAFGHSRGRLLDQGWNAWRLMVDDANALAFRAQQTRSLTSKRERRRVRILWNHWLLRVKEVSKLRARFTRLVAKEQFKLVSFAFEHLSFDAIAKKRRRFCGFRLGRHIRRRILSRALNSWSCYAAMLAEEKERDLRKQATMAKNGVETLQIELRHQRRLERHESWMSNIWLRHRILILLLRWALVVARLAVLHSVELSLHNRVTLELKSRIFGVMKQRMTYMRRLRKARVGIVRQILEGCARSTFSRWVLHTTDRKASKRSQGRVLFLMETNMIRRMRMLLAAWATFAQSQCRIDATHSKIVIYCRQRLLMLSFSALGAHLKGCRKLHRHWMVANRRFCVQMLIFWRAVASEQIFARLSSDVAAKEQVASESRELSQMAMREKVINSMCSRLGREWGKRSISEIVAAWSKRTKDDVRLRRNLIFLLGKRGIGVLEQALSCFKLHANIERDHSAKGRRLASKASRTRLAEVCRLWSAWTVARHNAGLRKQRAEWLQDRSRLRIKRESVSAWSSFVLLRRVFRYCLNKVTYLDRTRLLEVTMGRLLDLLYRRKQLRCCAERILFRGQTTLLRQCFVCWTAERTGVSERRQGLAALVARATRVCSDYKIQERSRLWRFKCLSRVMWGASKKSLRRRLEIAFREMRRHVALSNFVLRGLWHIYRRDCVRTLTCVFQSWMLARRQQLKVSSRFSCAQRKSAQISILAWHEVLEEQKERRSLERRLHIFWKRAFANISKAAWGNWRSTLRLSRAVEKIRALHHARMSLRCFIALRRYTAKVTFIRIAFERHQSKTALSLLQYYLTMWLQVVIRQRQKSSMSLLLCRRNNRAALHQVLLTWQRSSCSEKKRSILQSAVLMDGEYEFGKSRLTQKMQGLTKFLCKRARRVWLVVAYRALRRRVETSHWVLRSLWHLFRRNYFRTMQRALWVWGASKSRRKLSERNRSLIATRHIGSRISNIFSSWRAFSFAEGQQRQQARAPFLSGADGLALPPSQRPSVAGSLYAESPRLGGDAPGDVGAHHPVDRKLNMLKDLNSALLKRMVAGNRPPQG